MYLSDQAKPVPVKVQIDPLQFDARYHHRQSMVTSDALLFRNDDIRDLKARPVLRAYPKRHAFKAPHARSVQMTVRPLSDGHR